MWHKCRSLFQQSREKKSFAARLKPVEDKLHELRRRHIFGEVSMDLYQECSTELTTQKDAILCEVEQRTKKFIEPQP